MTEIERMRKTTAWLLLLGGVSLVAASSAAESLTRNRPQDEPRWNDVFRESPQARGFGQGSENVFKDRISPHWFHDNTRFWYRNDLRGDTKEFILVDAERGTREPAFDHKKLAAALSKATNAEYTADQLPFDVIEFSEDSSAVRFKIDDATWQCDLISYACSKTDASATLDAATEAEDNQNGRRRFGRRGGGGGRGERDRSPESPDGKWEAFIQDDNVYIRSTENDEEIQLSKDGEEGNAYAMLEWSPDSKSLVGWRIESAERKEVYLIQSSPPEGGRAKLRTRPYALPGDKFPLYEPNIFHVTDRDRIKPEVDRFEHEWLRPNLHWETDGRHFAYQQIDRGHQRFRVIEVDSQSGEVRNLIDEKTDTFIWTAHTESVRMDFVNWMENSDEIIYASERDGWRHLYLIDAKAGKIENQITRGEWVVRGIDRIDEENRQIWFQASGMNPDQDPYFIHYYRVNFDGTGLVAPTEGNGNHSVEYSPDRQYLIDTYSRVDMAPVNELRRVSDGKLICKLEEADISDLKTDGWEAPEVFVAKGRDGKTDIWGLINRPHDLDPGHKYPVIEDIYAGPQGSFVPKSFSARSRYESLTDLGFIVVKIDGMGTANRSKAFHDVCWKNLKDAGFEDRILWMKAAAEKYPYMDLTRVGVYGTSAGGQNAAGAVLFHPEFYKVAVANCGCHDNRMDKASWNEQWMGYMPPDKLWEKSPDNWYSQSSNIDNAYRLQGNLFLIVGEVDTNVPPESTMRFVDALIQAKKDFDLLVVPNANHGTRGPAFDYVQRRTRDFFVRHLLGVEPPDRNTSDSSES